MTIATLTQEIERLLKQRPCNAGEIKDSLGCSYPEIFSALCHLVREGKAVHYFHNGTSLPVLTYRAKQIWER